MNVNPGLICAIRGPIMLITLGVLFAIDHAGGLEFERTWPALIIVIGLMKLLERALTAQRPMTAAYPPQGWGQGPGPGFPGYPSSTPPPPAPPAPPTTGGTAQ